MQGTKFLAGAWGLESRARCAGFSVTEIGNRKERLRDYASFPDQSPKRNPNVKQIKGENQGAKRHLTDGWRIKAAFNRREAEMGFGDEIPKRGMEWQPQS